MANEIERRYGAKGLHGLSLNPGGILSGLQIHVPAEMMENWAKDESVVRYMKSPAQGAATTVYAALSKDWEGKGGRYLENCTESPPFAVDGTQISPGYAPFAYDEESEKRLWIDSLRMVGLADDE